MAPHDRTIHKLCQNNFTRHEAKHLYSIASQRTGKNTGHDLGDGRVALPEICAFLASEKTGAGDVTKEQARASACLDVKKFDAALQVVKRVLSSSSTAVGLKRVTCSSLVRQYEIREDANVAMMEVAQTLKQRGALKNTQVELESSVVQCAIFHWVSTKVFELAVPDFPVYQEQHRISHKTWSLVLRLLDKHCSVMVENLAALAKTAALSVRTRSQTRRQTQPLSTLALPNNGKHPLDDISPRKSIVKAMAGKVRKEPADVEEVKTSSKRRKGFTHTPSPLGQDQSPRTPTARTGSPATIPSQKSAQKFGTCPQDESEEDSVGTIVVQSRKKSFHHSDTAAWEAQRPKPSNMDLTPAQTPSSKHPTTSNGTDTFNDTPMTSTGMSDVFSDSPSRPRVVRTRFRSPSPAAMSSSSEEETSRRRNLRAPFLDRGAYSWKPSPHTEARLEQARKLEALMISNYGDPWEKL